MKREILHISEEKILDYRGKGPWSINGNIYEFFDTFLQEYPHIDGHAVIVKRKSDNKLFQYDWMFYRNSYSYDPKWTEVIAKEVVTIQYIWEDE